MDEFINEDMQEVQEISASCIIKDTLPWGIAILFHMALLLVALLVIYQINTPVEISCPQVSSNVRERQLVLPLEIAVAPTEEESSPREFSPVESLVPVQVMDMQVAVAGARGPAAPLRGFGEGIGVGIGEADGDGFFTPISGTEFEETVFVIDATGSLVDTLPHVKKELQRVLYDMSAQAKFNVIFYFGESYNRDLPNVQDGVAIFATELQLATPANIKAACAWAQQIESGGSNNPIGAIEQAFNMAPRQMVLLSDNISGAGKWQVSRSALLATMVDGADELYRSLGKSMSVQCVQFVHRDPLEAFGQTPLLQEIVQVINGTDEGYLFVSRERLGMR